MERTETDPGSGDMRTVPEKHRFPPFCMEEKGEAWKEGHLLNNIRLLSARPPAALCCTQTGVWERSLKEEQVQHLGAICFIPNVDS